MKDCKKIITNIIKELGIPADLKGYYFIRYAIEVVVNDITVIDRITKGLYPTVAKEFNTTAPKAERAIRHAIETGWNRANVDMVIKLFRYSISADKGKPTNSEFIATVADYILMTYDDSNDEEGVDYGR